MTNLAQTAAALVARARGILAADESVTTLTRRFDALQILSTPSSRRDYRELLLTTPNLDQHISGVILHDETFRQHSSAGTPLVDVCARLGLSPGIKVDAGTRPLAGHPGEYVTEGLDGLRERLVEYHRLGARFAKWRAVFAVSATLPSQACVVANADTLARFAALCQEQQLVPIVEPEVLADGSHTIERCEEVTSSVLHTVLEALFAQGVRLEGMLLAPNMVTSGDGCAQQANVATVAAATLRVLRRLVPAAVPGIVFLSGGQGDVVATRHLDAMNRAAGPRPWQLGFSFGRALQDAALAMWRDKPENAIAAQSALHHRARCSSLAARGAYTELEEQHPTAQRAREAVPQLFAAAGHDD